MAGTPCLNEPSGTRQQHPILFSFDKVALVLAGTVTSCDVSPVCTVNLSVGNLLFFVACHFLAVITIVLHHSVGMPTGTGVMIPLFTSSQRACLIGSLK